MTSTPVEAGGLVLKCDNCGDPVTTWGVVRLCNRCLCARLWEELEKDDWVMVRRHPNGDVWVQSNINGTRKGTNATYLGINIRTWFAERLQDWEDAA